MKMNSRFVLILKLFQCNRINEAMPMAQMTTTKSNSKSYKSVEDAQTLVYSK